ncbi:MAG: carboxypeptidase regulatory-like domain-containing protein [Rhodospirillales bacterium]
MRFRAVFTLLLASLAAGVPARLASGAILEGTVLDNAAARPLARSRVALTTLQNGYEIPLKTVLTGSGGNFRFDGLPAGTYFLTASRTGYQTARYGQKRWDGAGAPIILAAEAEFSCELRLRRLGAVNGTVLDENGVGLPGNTVTAYLAGSRPLRIAGSAVSDDRGIYRIAGLQPGVYYIRSGPQKLEDERSLLPTFFGQPSPAPVSVDLDSETGPIDIQPVAGSLGHLRGRITGAPVSWVWLFSDTGSKQTTPNPAGEFTFDQLAPGDYELLARAAAGSVAAYGKLRIRSGANEAVLAAAPMPMVRIRIEESEAKPVDPGRITTSLKRRGFSEQLPIPQPVPMLTGNGGLEVTPGEYVVVVQTSPEYYVRSVRAQDARELNVVEALPDRTVEVVITVSSRPSVLTGKVSVPGGPPVAGAPVFLDPLDQELRVRLGGTRMARSDAGGVYRFPGLPPGDYQVFSSFEFDSPQEQDFKSVPVKVVTIQEGAEVSLDLDLYGSM